jgi:hypothetical protein
MSPTICHRNLKTRSGIKPWKVKNGGKSDQGWIAPKQYIRRILCHGKFGPENSIYDMKWGAHTSGSFSPFVFTKAAKSIGRACPSMKKK